MFFHKGQLLDNMWETGLLITRKPLGSSTVVDGGFMKDRAIEYYKDRDEKKDGRNYLDSQDEESDDYDKDPDYSGHSDDSEASEDSLSTSPKVKPKRKVSKK